MLLKCRRSRNFPLLLLLFKSTSRLRFSVEKKRRIFGLKKEEEEKNTYLTKNKFSVLRLKQESDIHFSGVRQGNKEIIYVSFDTSLPKMERYRIVQSPSE